MKKILFRILCLVCLSTNFTVFAQESPQDTLPLPPSAVADNYKKFIPNFSPLSPNAASFQKYGDYQVNLASGVPDISIPLYTVQEGGLSNSITLRCHASGHTMSEFASWVGWGMNLDFGPSLNRSIMGGMADDNPSNGSYLKNPILDRDLCGSATDYTFATSVNNATADVDPDLFTLSGAANGKFMLRHGGLKPFLIPWQAVDIGYQTAINGVIQSFQVKNTEGVIYNFGISTDGNGTTETQRVYPDGASSGATDVGIVSWHVAKISAPNNADVIKFQYQNGGTVQQTSQSWSASMAFDASNNPVSQSVKPIPSRQVKEVDENNIYKIVFTNGEVEFVQSNNTSEIRLDQPESRYLKQINVYNYEAGVKNFAQKNCFQLQLFQRQNQCQWSFEIG